MDQLFVVFEKTQYLGSFGGNIRRKIRRDYAHAEYITFDKVNGNLYADDTSFPRDILETNCKIIYNNNTTTEDMRIQLGASGGVALLSEMCRLVHAPISNNPTQEECIEAFISAAMEHKAMKTAIEAQASASAPATTEQQAQPKAEASAPENVQKVKPEAQPLQNTEPQAPVQEAKPERKLPTPKSRKHVYDFSTCKDADTLRKALNAGNIDTVKTIAENYKEFQPSTDEKRMTKKDYVMAIVKLYFPDYQPAPTPAQETPQETHKYHFIPGKIYVKGTTQNICSSSNHEFIRVIKRKGNWITVQEVTSNFEPMGKPERKKIEYSSSIEQEYITIDSHNISDIDHIAQDYIFAYCEYSIFARYNSTVFSIPAHDMAFDETAYSPDVQEVSVIIDDIPADHEPDIQEVQNSTPEISAPETKTDIEQPKAETSTEKKINPMHEFVPGCIYVSSETLFKTYLDQVNGRPTMRLVNAYLILSRTKKHLTAQAIYPRKEEPKRFYVHAEDQEWDTHREYFCQNSKGSSEAYQHRIYSFNLMDTEEVEQAIKNGGIIHEPELHPAPVQKIKSETHSNSEPAPLSAEWDLLHSKYAGDYTDIEIVKGKIKLACSCVNMETVRAYQEAHKQPAPAETEHQQKSNKPHPLYTLSYWNRHTKEQNKLCRENRKIIDTLQTAEEITSIMINVGMRSIFEQAIYDRIHISGQYPRETDEEATMRFAETYAQKIIARRQRKAKAEARKSAQKPATKKPRHAKKLDDSRQLLIQFDDEQTPATVQPAKLKTRRTHKPRIKRDYSRQVLIDFVEDIPDSQINQRQAA